MKHELTEYESDFLEDGYRSACSCGWKSDLVPSLPAALVEYQIHTREALRDETLAAALVKAVEP